MARFNKCLLRPLDQQDYTHTHTHTTTHTQEQSELFWKKRDQLKANLSKSDLQLMLEENNQHVPAGESNVSNSTNRCSGRRME